MTVSTDEQQANGGSSLPMTISNAIVKVIRDYTGRGPGRARTTIRDNVVLVMLEQNMSKGEQTLTAMGQGQAVLAIRREYQEAIREESSDRVAELTGCRVNAMLSANHLDPDLAAEIYVLDSAPNYDHRTWEKLTDTPVTNDPRPT
jgi:uncharacterized protein YbcI